ncbi:hypothetical protein ID853_09630 [Xenorhabdus sp. Vera]|uniref:hypothetical protein n=1 Tax=Xenorhabdus koppenhoeferi TaxID=351659 RepID=UPI0019CDB295|nr:hypothetical protein [Xenorhabdus sp. Vera]MBD2811134.1 hypothetical protein [Xenorhabdus sp. Vera]
MPVYKSKEKVKYSKKNSYNIPHNNQLIVQDLMPTSLQETATPLLTHEFKQGDILYGLDTPRASALSNLDKMGFKRKSTATASSNTLLSRFGKLFGKKGKIKNNILIQNDITNAVWDASKPTEYANDKNIRKELHDYNRAIGFREFLSNHPKYNVKNGEPFITALMTNPSPNAAVPLWKKTSKAGLEYQLMHRKAPVHFLVDTIGDDISTVISKQGHGASITSSELRWLYRHKDTEEVKQNLKFWRNGKVVPHSEVFSEQKWDSYHPKNRYPKIDNP